VSTSDELQNAVIHLEEQFPDYAISLAVKKRDGLKFFLVESFDYQEIEPAGHPPANELN